ncbi:MAG: hypothetical protein H6581_26955 [Bacteroidia bacterium]|nr:hypothetical protein [Bacteroidia bacterium]
MKSFGLGIALLLTGVLITSTFNFFISGSLDPQLRKECLEAAFSFRKEIPPDTSNLSEESELLTLGSEASSAFAQPESQQVRKP